MCAFIIYFFFTGGVLGCENSRNVDTSVVCVTPDVCAAALPHLVRADRLIVLRGPAAGPAIKRFYNTRSCELCVTAETL